MTRGEITDISQGRHVIPQYVTIGAPNVRVGERWSAHLLPTSSRAKLAATHSVIRAVASAKKPVSNTMPNVSVCELSIIVPFLNEEDSLPELLRRILENDDLPQCLELIFVSDGSTDRSISIIKQAAEHDRRIKLLELSRNFGHQAAVSAGLDHARGAHVAVMDADLQDEPHVLAEMLRRARGEVWDVVYAVRSERNAPLVKRFAYRAFYRLYGFLSETPVSMDSGDFCVMSRRCLHLMRQLPERSRFHRGLRSWVGLRQVDHPVKRPDRFAGRPQYSWKGLVQLAVHGLTSFSIRPLRLASLLGVSLCLLSALAALGYVAMAFMFDLPSSVPGFTTIVCLLLFLNGVILVQLGIIGEYVGNTFLEVKGRPTYLVESAINLTAPNDHDVPQGADSSSHRAPTDENVQSQSDATHPKSIAAID